MVICEKNYEVCIMNYELFSEIIELVRGSVKYGMTARPLGENTSLSLLWSNPETPSLSGNSKGKNRRNLADYEGFCISLRLALGV